jgi:23S rRNA (guanosine2251-2'-O)-methyltransferase
MAISTRSFEAEKQQSPTSFDADYIFGIRPVIEAIEAGKEIEKIFLKKNLESATGALLFKAIKGKQIPVQRVPVEKLNKITRKNHQGVIALLSPISYQRLEDLIPAIYETGTDPFLVLLDGVGYSCHSFCAS